MNRTAKALPLVFAHRGARAVAPENTLPAFRTALEMGVAGIELDVQLSRDGRLVVIHDFTLERTTNGQGRVRDCTAAQLAQLDACSHLGPEFAPAVVRGVAHAGVPTLEEVFDLVGDACQVNVEIKTAEPAGGGQEVAALVRTIRRRGLHDQVIVSSFGPLALVRLRRAAPDLARGMLYAPDRPVHIRRAWLRPLVRPAALHPRHTMISAAYMQWARGKGYAVNTWTVNEVEEARRLAGLGVRILISDVPDVLMKGLRGMEDAS